MTNEEMIKDLSQIMDLLDMYIDLKQSLNITQMEFAHLRLQCIVKALEQQPCEDCVSRESVKKLKKYHFSYDTNTTIPKSDVFVKVSDVADLPSIAPQRPKGHWISIHPLQEDDDGAYMCSNCEHGDWDCDTSYKYCPFCGADMRGDEE